MPAVAAAERDNAQIFVVPGLPRELLGLSGLLHAQPVPLQALAVHHLDTHFLYICLAVLLLFCL